MDEYESLSHTKWECKYHVVFIPKRRRRACATRSDCARQTGIDIGYTLKASVVEPYTE